MSDKKIKFFSTLLLFGIAAIFFPATALQNSIAIAQEFYPEYEEENKYYDQEYDPYKNNNNKNAPIVNVEKKLFICNNVTDSPNDFACEGVRVVFDDDFFFAFPPAPDSGEYLLCNDEICPDINESDFAVQIFKDVVTVRDLSSEGTPVNLDKFHYTVTERSIQDRIETISQCSTAGFSHDLFIEKLTDDSLNFYAICVNYVGDCEGTIYPDEVKTCTIENYIYEKFTDPIQIDGGNSAGDVQSSSLSSSSQLFNNQRDITDKDSKLETLKDIIDKYYQKDREKSYHSFLQN
jgi:hypothetical protein